MRETPMGSGRQHSSSTPSRARESAASSPYERSGRSAQHKETAVRVRPKGTDSGGGNPYDRGNGEQPQHREDTRRMSPKSTSGDKERPVHMTVKRARAPITAKRPKHVSPRRALT